MLEINSKSPSFIALDENKNQIDFNDYLGKKSIVLFFYPKDHTPGCTKEACTFRDQYEQFANLNGEVFGISSDGVNSHSSFKEKYKLPFKLLSDPKGELRKLFKVPTALFGLIPGRVSYVINKEGIVKGAFNSQLNPVSHVSKTLKCLKEIS